MRHKVADLEGKNLDTAVNVAEWKRKTDGRWVGEPRAYSTEWKHGGPIIERERTSVIREGWRDDGWIAGTNAEMGPCNRLDHQQFGPTPLVAAMRAYVASVFGDEVEL